MPKENICTDKTRGCASGNQRGCFVVLEGIDGSGTTTQARNLVEALEQSGYRAHLTREPSDGPFGMLIRQILTGRLISGLNEEIVPVDGAAVALLFAADRVDHLRSEIEPALDAGIHVISDRYVMSSMAYQSLDNDPEWIREINRLALKPDLTVFLDVSPEAALERRLSSRRIEERFDSLPQQKRIAESYRKEAEATFDSGRIVAVNGMAPMEEVSKLVQKEVFALIGEIGNSYL